MVARYRRNGGRSRMVLWLAALATGCSGAPADDRPTDIASPTQAPTVATPGATVSPTSSPVPADLLRVTAELEVDMADARIVGPSPDGMYVASWSPEEGLCVHGLPALEEVSCSEFEPDDPSRHVDTRSITWSPDATRIAFHEELFRMGEESDIWTLDVPSGVRTNLTDDGASGSVFDADEGAFFDVAPAWSPDGMQIAFGRTPSTRTGSELDVVIADGSASPSRLASVSDDPIAVYFGTRWSADGANLAYVLRAGQSTSQLDGIHVVSAAGGTSRQVLGPHPDNGRPSLLGLSPDATIALIVYDDALASRGAAGDFYHVLQMDDGALESVRHPAPDDADPTFVVNAVLSPDATKVAYAYRSGAMSRLAVRDLAGGPENVLVERAEPGPFGLVEGFTGLAWPTDEVLYVPITRSSGIVYRLGVSPP